MIVFVVVIVAVILFCVTVMLFYCLFCLLFVCLFVSFILRCNSFRNVLKAELHSRLILIFDGLYPKFFILLYWPSSKQFLTLLANGNIL